MKYLAEKEAEDFLEEKKFNVVQRKFTSKKLRLPETIKKVGTPFVMKASGKRLVHKNRIKGVVTQIRNYSEALQAFKKLKKLKGSQGVLIQKKIEGKEFLLGIKKTKEFGNIIAFGVGGTKTEEMKKVSFRATPLDKKEGNKMIKEIIPSKKINLKNKKILLENILKISKLAEENPKIKELDINPLIVKKGKATIVDARIVFE